jgi:ABC-type lipoprotein export system ATPase subunit
MRNKEMLAAKNLSKTYSSEGVDYQALQNVDLHIDRGDCVAIVGKSAAENLP